MMKYTTTHHYLTLSLLLLISISISISISGAAGQDSPVKDDDDNEVKVGLEYTLVTRILGGGVGSGGLSLDSACPPSIVENDSDSVGLPLVFHSMTGTDDEVVRTSSELIIKFAAPTKCDNASSTTWEIQYDESLKKSAVKVGSGVVGSYFKLTELWPSEYELSYCVGPSTCQDIRFFGPDLFYPRKRLVATSSSFFKDVPFMVTITRATTKNNLSYI